MPGLVPTWMPAQARTSIQVLQPEPESTARVAPVRELALAEPLVRRALALVELERAQVEQVPELARVLLAEPVADSSPRPSNTTAESAA